MSETVSIGSASLAAPLRLGEAPRALRDARVEAIVREHYGFAWRVLRRFGLGPSDADDAAQQVFLVVSDRLGDIAPDKERAFLFQTAVHVASKAHRSRRRRPEDADADCGESEDLGPSADELVERRRARALLDRILDELPIELRAVLVLFEIEGLTMSEIAEATEVPPGTVASRLRRARAALEEKLLSLRVPVPSGGAVP